MAGLTTATSLRMGRSPPQAHHGQELDHTTVSEASYFEALRVALQQQLHTAGQPPAKVDQGVQAVSTAGSLAIQPNPCCTASAASPTSQTHTQWPD